MTIDTSTKVLIESGSFENQYLMESPMVQIKYQVTVVMRPVDKKVQGLNQNQMAVVLRTSEYSY